MKPMPTVRPLTSSSLGHIKSVPLPSIERLRYLFTYDDQTGVFTRRVDLNNRWRSGTVAGSECGPGYWRIIIDGQGYLAHRLAWKYFFGTDPGVYIDHINGNGLDNRIVNLREADPSQNIANSRKRTYRGGTTIFPFKGVCVAKQKQGIAYTAQISFRGKRYFIGNFKTPEEARAAYIAKQSDLHGQYSRPV